MKLEKKTIDLWKIKFNDSLPGLLESIQEQKSDSFLIGAYAGTNSSIFVFKNLI